MLEKMQMKIEVPRMADPERLGQSTSRELGREGRESQLDWGSFQGCCRQMLCFYQSARQPRESGKQEGEGPPRRQDGL